MLVPEVFANDPMLVIVAAPLALSACVVPLVLKTDSILESESFHPLDAEDSAGWNRSNEWLSDAPIEKIHLLPKNPQSRCSVTEISSGWWRTLRQHGSVQSVTLMMTPEDNVDDKDDLESLVPFHSSVGNEYLKAMASTYAALSGVKTYGNEIGEDFIQKPASKLHLGLGGGSLPMLLGEPCSTIELGNDAVDLAIGYCGLDPQMVSIVKGGDALDHRELVSGPHPCIVVDVFGRDNNVPPPFVQEDFVQGLWDSHEGDDGGLVIANFHYNNGMLS